jgi:hypothetical protein
METEYLLPGSQLNTAPRLSQNSAPTYLFKTHLILLSHLGLGLTNSFYSSCVPAKSKYALFFASMRAI